MYEIKRLITNEVLFKSETATTLREAILEAVAKRADLRGADLRGAYLRGAYLRGAYLSGAYLRCADLSCADLRGADLRCADLRGAYLRGADLSGADLSGAYLRCADLSCADLRGADLSGAYLRCADLRGADLSGAYLRCADLSCADLRGADLSGAILNDETVIDTGESWKVYKAEVVPQLLIAGGRKKIPAKAWDCHSWTNCPMAAAFGVHHMNDIPAYHRPRADQFIRFFDAGLLDDLKPKAKKAAACEAAK